MDITLPMGHPLAQAITESPGDLWLVLKDRRGFEMNKRETRYRATVKQWTQSENTLTVELESWEDYAEREAQRMGL